jgi:hypothetical protein
MNTIPTTLNQIFGQKLDDISIIDSIEIPIIQRDYAQGRETTEVNRIRNQFVDVLYKALTGSDEDAVKLDFIYGNVENGKLIPLDGQQRLTTLFLLHWYIAKHESIDISEQEFLSKFSYKTRFSSQHFCNEIVKHTPDFDVEILSDWIKDQNWFMYSWEKDPTIKAMLVMLDKIHMIFKNETDLWNRLTAIENPPISFYFLPLDEMGVTDSLYIKMNSRGKPLTEFEHFKAEFEKIIKTISQDLYNEFIDKVDVAWVDMLWKYRDETNNIDDKFMKFYRYITEMICYEQEVEIFENDFDLASIVYGKENPLAEQNLKFLFKSFDCWLTLDDIDLFFESTFSNSEYEVGKVALHSDKKNLFAQCCHSYNDMAGNRRLFSLNNMLFLYGVVQYLVHEDQVQELEFKRRIRTIRNLISNSQFEIRETRLKALLEDVKNIILKDEIVTKTSGFNESQKAEEIEKIYWRATNPNLSEDLNRLEDHSLLLGSVSIIGLRDLSQFSTRVDKFIDLFNSDVPYDSIKKAMLSIGDYSQLASWRFLFANDNAATWREIFTPSVQRKGFENTHEVLVQLLDSIDDDFYHSLDKIISTYLNNEHVQLDWRYYFVSYDLMREGDSGVYYWYNDDAHVKANQYVVYMMNTALSLNGKHWNPFLYVVKHDPEFTDFLSIDDYYSPLRINKNNHSIHCKNDCWLIVDDNESEVKTIPINQSNGTDTIDRIELLKNYLRTELN